MKKWQAREKRKFLSHDDAIASLEQVSRFYDDGRVIALCDVTLGISRGESLAIVGPSGSGKSTLLHLLCGLDRPTQGRVFFEGIEPGSAKEWTDLRSERIGFVFQAFNLLSTLTALENVEVPMFGVKRRAEDRRQQAADLLARVGLAERTHHRPSELSAGERQRVAIARSLANSPDLILADEPTGNLDSKTSAEILNLLGDIHVNEGTTLVVVTHEREIASRVSRVVRLVDGWIVSD